MRQSSGGLGGESWNLATLIRHIIEEATGEPARTQVWGPNWYQTLDGEVLHKVAEPLGDAGGERFDWSRLHLLLAALPSGRWTTYGELAEVVGTVRGRSVSTSHGASSAQTPGECSALTVAHGRTLRGPI